MTATIRPLAASCPICFGVGVWGDQGYPCRCREEVPPSRVRQVLMLLSVEQMAYLRAFEHTLADQPITLEEFDAHRCELWVEDDDAVIDGYEIVVPATKIWFAGGSSHSPAGSTEWRHSIRYNPLGLALREALMAGASAKCR